MIVRRAWRLTERHEVAGPRIVQKPRARRDGGFTLVEMILVMALLVVAVSVIAPNLAGFFRGRNLQAEGRQFLGLVHIGQSRAVSGGVPMMLWIDLEQKKYGLEEEPGYTDKDPDALEFTLNESLRMEIGDENTGLSPASTMPDGTDNPHLNLPRINLLPDGGIEDSSPKTIRILDTEGDLNLRLTIQQTRDRNSYEIATNANN